MKHYMLFIHQGGPVVGAVEVPPCFTPTQELLNEAAKAGLGLALATEEQIGEVGGLSGLLLKQGEDMLDILKRYVEDPSSEQFIDTDPTLN